MVDCLLPPLWELTASYLDAAERWFYRDVSCLRTAKAPFDYLKILEAAVHGNHLHMIPQMNNFDFIKWSESTILTIIGLDRLEFLIWVRDRQPVAFHYLYYRSEFAQASARACATRVFMWEVCQGLVPVTQFTVEILVEAGHYDALEILMADGCLCQSHIISAAVTCGKRDVIQRFARAFDCTSPRVNMVLSAHLPSASFDMLQFTVETLNLVQYPKVLNALFVNVADRGTLEMLQYLAGLSSFPGEALQEAMFCACGWANTTPAKAEYLLSRGAPLPPRIVNAPPEIKKWLISRGG